VLDGTARVDRLEPRLGPAPLSVRRAASNGASVNDLVASLEARLAELGRGAGAAAGGEARDLRKWLAGLAGVESGADGGGGAVPAQPAPPSPASPAAPASPPADPPPAETAVIRGAAASPDRGRPTGRRRDDVGPETTVTVRHGDATYDYATAVDEPLRRVLAAHASAVGSDPRELAYIAPRLRVALPHHTPRRLGLDEDTPLACIAIKRRPRVPPVASF